jgi:HAD superfamily hydrolase (TIGR01549 family)
VIRAVAFDFDGVILESADIKTNAFAELFAAHPEHVESIVALHLEQQGISRFDKFRQIHDEILQLPLSDERERELGERFSEIVFAQLERCAFVNGAQELLAALAPEVPLYVASGTPEEELRDLVARREIAHHFAGVHGTPRGKPEILREILANHSLETTELLFVGDATSDLEAAIEVGTPFVARVAVGELDQFADPTLFRVDDMAHLAREWEGIAASPPPPPRASP